MSQDVFGIVNTQAISQNPTKGDTSQAAKSSASSEFSSEFEKYASDSDKKVKQQKANSERGALKAQDKAEKDRETKQNNGKTLPDELKKHDKDTEASAQVNSEGTDVELEVEQTDNTGYMLVDENIKQSNNTSAVNSSMSKDKSALPNKASAQSLNVDAVVIKHANSDQESSSAEKSLDGVKVPAKAIGEMSEKTFTPMAETVSTVSAKASIKTESSPQPVNNTEIDKLGATSSVNGDVTKITPPKKHSDDGAHYKVAATPTPLANELDKASQNSKTNSIGLDEVIQQTTSESKKTHSLRSDISYAISSRASDSESKKDTSETLFKAVLDGVSSSKKSEVVPTEKAMLAQSLMPETSDKAKIISQPSPQGGEKSFSSHTLSPASNLSYSHKPDVPVLDIQPTLQSAAWSRVMGARVVWMAREGVQQASLQLNPANLGPVEVKLHVSHEQANVTFIAQSSATRDALEQAIPRLRESFQQNGMELNNADVSQQSFQQEHNNDRDVDKNSKLALLSQSADEDIEDNVDKIIMADDQSGDSGLSVYA